VSYAAAAMGGGSSATKDVDAVDWLNLPCPVKYEEIQRENISKWNQSSLLRLNHSERKEVCTFYVGRGLKDVSSCEDERFCAEPPGQGNVSS
jgi:hypothetical protein